MPNKDHLYELIVSLSAPEKAYFKKTTHKTGAQYIRLFDELNSLKKFDEKKLRAIYKSHGKGSVLIMNKNYLFDAITEALVQFNRQSDPEAELNNQIEKIKTLFNKGLYDVCEQLLHKAKRVAHDNQFYSQLLQLIAFEYSFNQFKLRDSSALFEEEREVLELISGTNKINDWYSKLMLWLQHNDKIKSDEQKNELNDLHAQSKELVRNKTSFKAANTLFAADTIYYYSLGDMQKAMRAKINQLENYFNNPTLRSGNYRTFLLVYSNTLSLVYNAGEIDLMEKYLKQFQNYFEKKSAYGILEKEIMFTHSVNLFKLKKDFEAGINFVNSISVDLEYFGKKFSIIRYTDICFNIAVMFFWCGKFKDSLLWLNKILQNPGVEKRQYIYCCTRIFELVVHFELGNMLVVQSYAASTHRYLYKRNKVHDFERIMLQYIKLLIRTPHQTKQKEILKSLKEELLVIAKDSIKSSSMEHFDYIAWINTKI